MSTENDQPQNTSEDVVKNTVNKQRLQDSNQRSTETNIHVKDKNRNRPRSKEARWLPREQGQPRLTRKQKLYADYLLNNPKASHTEAVKHAYRDTTQSTRGVIASENIKKPNIQMYLENHGYNAVADIIQIAKYSKEYGNRGDRDGASYASVALAANRDIADRAFGKATQRTEVISKSVSVNIDLTGTVSDVQQAEHRADRQ